WIVSRAPHRAASRRPGTLSRHSPQGRLFVVCLALVALRRGLGLAQPRNPGSIHPPKPPDARKTTSLPCPRRDRSEGQLARGSSDFRLHAATSPASPSGGPFNSEVRVIRAS